MPAARGADGRGQGARRAATSWCAASPTRASLPVPNFAAGGIATPADAALMMQLGAEAVFVGSGIFKSDRSGRAGPGHRSGHDALQRPGRSSPRFRGAWAMRCAGSRRLEARRVRAAADAGVVRRCPDRRTGAAGGFRPARGGSTSSDQSGPLEVRHVQQPRATSTGW